MSFLSTLPDRPLIMGILNVTPDSFSDGGDFFVTESARDHALRMIEEGADIIDIGGESTRPPGAAYGQGAKPIDAREEIRRVIPVIEAIRRENVRVPISIDTVKSEVAEAAIIAGANIINDVSAATTDTRVLEVAARYQTPLILMHGHGPEFRKERIEEYQYDDVVKDVKAYLNERVMAARKVGVTEVWIDIGFGFAKVYADNLRLLKHHSDFLELGVPLVLGVSRKSSIGRAIGEEIPPKGRLLGSIAAACYGAEHGARIVRTHDVRETREALSVLNAILTIPERDTSIQKIL